MNHETVVNEVNFDGLAGPSYNFQALSPGNLASRANQGAKSDPRSAALEGIAKAEVLLSLGVRQAILPPQLRPNLYALYRIGLLKDKALLHADDFDALATKLAECATVDQHVVAAVFSGASVWTANTATVSSSADTDDGKVHFTPANMISLFHRSLEAEEAGGILKQIFPDENHFVVHDPLPQNSVFGDEGAANHLRLAREHGARGVNVFVYGREGLDDRETPARYTPRQTRSASEAIARLHGLHADRTLFVKQNPSAIDAGVFHNDVIATANLDMLFYHERAFQDSARVLCRINDLYSEVEGGLVHMIEVRDSELSIEEAVTSYLFNSQVVIDRDGKTVLLAPRDCERIPRVKRFLDDLMAREMRPAERLMFVNTSSSMRNGGGPACLRLRVLLTEDQLKLVRGRVILDMDLLKQLRDLITSDYPTEVTGAMFSEASFLRSCFSTTCRIYEILGLKPTAAWRSAV